jgi:uncharacterized protein YggE
MGIWNRIRQSKQAAAGLALAGLMVASAAGGVAKVGAQDATPAAGAASTNVSTITVNGVGNVSMTPDTASVTLGVNIFAKTLKEAQAQATDQMNAVIAELKSEGIDAKDIQTSNYSVSVNQNYDSNGTPGEVVGYTVNNQVTVTIRNLPKLGSILDQVVEKGANSIWGISFFVNDQTDAAKQARKLAVQDAAQHAQEIAEAAGVKVGKVLSINETYGPSPSPVAYESQMAGGKGGSVPVQTGSTLVTASVTITYEFLQ